MEAKVTDRCLTDAEIIDHVEDRAARADKVRGPDYRKIAEDVANEAGVSYTHVRQVMIDHWQKYVGAS